jgi:hypothetical protein
MCRGHRAGRSGRGSLARQHAGLGAPRIDARRVSRGANYGCGAPAYARGGPFANGRRCSVAPYAGVSADGSVRRVCRGTTSVSRTMVAGMAATAPVALHCPRQLQYRLVRSWFAGLPCSCSATAEWWLPTAASGADSACAAAVPWPPCIGQECNAAGSATTRASQTAQSAQSERCSQERRRFIKAGESRWVCYRTNAIWG